ncbi:MAG: ribonuclease HI family protein [Syntrophobacteria bacterium]
MESNDRLDRERLSRVLELVAKRLPVELLLPEFPELTQDDIRRLLQDVADHVRTCQEWPPAGNAGRWPEVRQMYASLYCDGASQGNPGPAGAGVLLLDQEGEQLFTFSRFLDTATSNEAEYQALISGLEAAADLGINRVQIFMDSQLVVRQILGEYRVRHPRLQHLFDKAVSRLQRFDDYDIVHIGRERNKQADRLAREAIERALRGGERELYWRARKE